MKKIFLLLLAIFIVIQFFHPEKNIAGASAYEKDITKVYIVPDSVQKILEASCYDCHSNNTAYPWYNNIQPVAWWLHNHIEDGKRGLNFSEFAGYRIGKQYRRFGGIIKEIQEGDMPLSSYTLIHRYAILSDAQKKLIIDWATAIKDSIQKHTPSDSLTKK